MNTAQHCFLTATLLLAACNGDKKQPPPPPPEVPVVQVITRDVPVYLEAVGETLGSLDIQIRARVDGVVEKVHFAEGKYVDKGDPLYTIDPAPFEAKVREAEGQLAEARARFVRAESDLNRVRPLVEIDALSKRALDDSIAEFEASKGLVKAAEAIVENAKIDLGYCQIDAPIDGLIGVSEAYASDYVGRYPNPIVLATVSKLDPIKVRFSISEQDYLRLVRKVQAAEASGQKRRREKSELELFLADGTLYPHTGEFSFAGREIDAKTGTLLIEAEFPNPVLEIENEDGEKKPFHKIRPGQFARVRVTVATKKNAPLVPQRAVREIQGTYQVFVVTDQNKVESRNVKVGVRVGELWLIEEGVSSGE
ncbi:MAG: efflux RND transporter periplasmic adaptor subunit, partial [Planctomycetota bacterium]